MIISLDRYQWYYSNFVSNYVWFQVIILKENNDLRFLERGTVLQIENFTQGSVHNSRFVYSLHMIGWAGDNN